jgi:hypothetical protein
LIAHLSAHCCSLTHPTVSHASTGKALPATYVKVYAKSDSGEVSFYKDGCQSPVLTSHDVVSCQSVQSTFTGLFCDVDRSPPVRCCFSRFQTRTCAAGTTTSPSAQTSWTRPRSWRSSSCIRSTARSCASPIRQRDKPERSHCELNPQSTLRSIGILARLAPAGPPAAYMRIAAFNWICRTKRLPLVNNPQAILVGIAWRILRILRRQILCCSCEKLRDTMIRLSLVRFMS